MNARLASLIAAAALAMFAGPALAQEGPEGPPPGPEFRDGPPPMPAPRQGPQRFERRGMPPMGAPRFGYSPEQRGAWLDECRSNHPAPPPHDGPRGRRRGHPAPDQGPGGWSEYCESYLQHYEGAPIAPMGPGMIQPGYVTPGYVVPPLMWVKVPIIHERHDCGCEEVIEEEVVTRAAPPPRAHRAVQHRRVVHDKRIRYAK